MKQCLLLLACLLSLQVIAQQDTKNAITLEELWKDYKFLNKRVPGFNFLNDGKHYSRLEDNSIKKYDITNGEFVGDILSAEKLKLENGFEGEITSYSFNEDESFILIETDEEPIYRRSYTSTVYVYDVNGASMVPVFDKPVMNATLSPDKKRMAFVYENNIYVRNADGEVAPITTDGKKNQIINGITDWVYEEEFAFVQAYQWSPDGSYIAYIKFDESDVPEFTMTNYRDELYPEYVTWKYPKVGEKNAEVSLHIYNVRSGKTTQADIGNLDDMYIPRIKWTRDNNALCAFKMNRHQNNLELLTVDASTGKSKLLYQEKNKYYIDITDNLHFLKNGDFILTSEADGFNHIYLFNNKGELKNQITKGDFDVTDFYGVDEENQRVYYQAAAKSPLEKEVYAASLKNGKSMQLSTEAGTNSAQFSSTYDYFVLNHSTINTPPSYVVYNGDKKKIRVIEDNKALGMTQDSTQLSPVEFFNFQTTEGVALNGWMIKPMDFKPEFKYPVFMYLYGGPGSQQVTDSWKGQNYWWFQMLAQQGYVVACVDNRGTGGRGEEFKKMTYLKLGHYETIDQIEAAKYLGGLDFTDEERIGIFGWSYGGYMSSLCLFKGNDVFKAAIAVAPVTSWKWYDTIYTERYMRTLEENKEGYEDNSPIYFADRLKGAYLLVHGMGDDNVHFQNSAEMAAALVAANKQFDTYYYPNRNHGIYGGPTRLHLYTKMTNFIFDNL